jgi:hypothetical protein
MISQAKMQALETGFGPGVDRFHGVKDLDD